MPPLITATVGGMSGLPLISMRSGEQKQIWTGPQVDPDTRVPSTHIRTPLRCVIGMTSDLCASASRRAHPPPPSRPLSLAPDSHRFDRASIGCRLINAPLQRPFHLWLLKGIIKLIKAPRVSHYEIRRFTWMTAFMN